MLKDFDTEVLLHNLVACGESIGTWKLLAEGELEEKPKCPFCNMPVYVEKESCYYCTLDAISVGEQPCGDTYGNWEVAQEQHGIKSPEACHYAKEMLEVLNGLRGSIIEELQGRI